MEAFKAASIRELGEGSLSYDLQHWDLDEWEFTIDPLNEFDRFVAGRSIGWAPGNIDPRNLVTGRDTVKGQKHVCPPNTVVYLVPVEVKP
jgi:hypothetical protein